jgi:ABC-2 type transport system permease protein
VTIFVEHLRENRRGFVGWAVAITAVAAMYSGFWPVFGHNAALTSAIDAFPQSMKDAFHMTDYSTPSGYFGSTVFGLLVPLLVAVFAIAAGVRAIAGDEEAHTLELVAAYPVRRARLALARYAATLAAMVGAGALLFVVVVAIRVPAKFTELPIGKIAATVVMLTLFGVCFASIAFGIGAYTGRRAISLGAGAYLAVVTYLCASFLPQINGFGRVKYVSPFAWYLDGQPLRNGLNWVYCGLLVGLGALFATVGIWRFGQRDLT